MYEQYKTEFDENVRVYKGSAKIYLAIMESLK